MVGARLRQLRLHRNLRQETAANAIDASISKISRMEAGLVPFRRQDVLALLTLYGVADPYQQETLLSVALGHRNPGWWDYQDAPLEETVLWGHEQVADLIRIYQPHLVPDLLQTAEYARAAHRARHFTSPTEAATDTSEKNVTRRQQMLRERGTRLWAVIDEPALWRPIGGDLDAHLRQLDALTSASWRHGVTIQIMPTGSPYLPSCEPFTIFRLPDRGQILAVHRYIGDEITDLVASEHYGILFDQLIGVARRRADTPQILATIRDRLLAEGRS
jgi:transcriptional regulator with XRE-family HTH domain